jgi:hypothetical protein
VTRTGGEWSRRDLDWRRRGSATAARSGAPGSPATGRLSLVAVPSRAGDRHTVLCCIRPTGATRPPVRMGMSYVTAAANRPLRQTSHSTPSRPWLFANAQATSPEKAAWLTSRRLMHHIARLPAVGKKSCSQSSATTRCCSTDWLAAYIYLYISQLLAPCTLMHENDILMPVQQRSLNPRRRQNVVISLSDRPLAARCKYSQGDYPLGVRANRKLSWRVRGGRFPKPKALEYKAGVTPTHLRTSSIPG